MVLACVLPNERVLTFHKPSGATIDSPIFGVGESRMTTAHSAKLHRANARFYLGRQVLVMNLVPGYMVPHVLDCVFLSTARDTAF
mmetsp:Transcript_32509/g.71725  ORF Transcript_32509/g.71725 Transcript_32509/m.71725 type:complete len:85 (-) Transcript_32509:3562-3816(-)